MSVSPETSLRFQKCFQSIFCAQIYSSCGRKYSNRECQPNSIFCSQKSPSENENSPWSNSTADILMSRSYERNTIGLGSGHSVNSNTSSTAWTSVHRAAHRSTAPKINGQSRMEHNHVGAHNVKSNTTHKSARCVRSIRQSLERQ